MMQQTIARILARTHALARLFAIAVPAGCSESSEDPDPQPTSREASSEFGEVGTVRVSQASSSQWHEIALTRAYDEPVVVMGPATAANRQPLTVRVRNVEPDSFEFQLDEWDYLDGQHPAETLSYVVVEAGKHLLLDGSIVVARRSRVNDADTAISWDAGFAAPPVVVAQTMTTAGTNAVTVRIDQVTEEGFVARLQEQESSSGDHPTETVGWMALETGARTSGVAIDAGRTSATVTQADAALAWPSFASTPALFAQLQTRNGLDPAGVRARAVTLSGATIFVEEEQSHDAERTHAGEVVGYAAMQQGSLSGSSCDLPVDPANDPNAPHADTRTPYFEGWYYRVTDQNDGRNLAVIAEFHRNPEDAPAGSQRRGGFIKILDPQQGASYYYEFPLSDAEISALQNEDRFDVTLGGVRFTPSRIVGSLTAERVGDVAAACQEPELVPIELDLRIDNCWYWGAPDDPGSRWTMGVAELPLIENFVPLKWHVHGMRGVAEGSVSVGERDYAFDGALVHSEKNWGEQFPVFWIWMETTKLSSSTGTDAAFAAAGGPMGLPVPPQLSREGYMAGLRYGDVFVPFRTQDAQYLAEYNTTFETAEYSEGVWTLEATARRNIYPGRNYRIELTAVGNEDTRLYAQGPLATGPAVTSFQNLDAQMTIQLYAQDVNVDDNGEPVPSEWALLDTLYTDHAAVEAGGTYAAAIDDEFNLEGDEERTVDIFENDLVFERLVEDRRYTVLIDNPQNLPITLEDDYRVSVAEGLEPGIHEFFYVVEDDVGGRSDRARVQLRVCGDDQACVCADDPLTCGFANVLAGGSVQVTYDIPYETETNCTTAGTIGVPVSPAPSPTASTTQTLLVWSTTTPAPDIAFDGVPVSADGFTVAEEERVRYFYWADVTCLSRQSPPDGSSNHQVTGLPAATAYHPDCQWVENGTYYAALVTAYQDPQEDRDLLLATDFTPLAVTSTPVSRTAVGMTADPDHGWAHVSTFVSGNTFAVVRDGQGNDIDGFVYPYRDVSVPDYDSNVGTMRVFMECGELDSGSCMLGRGVWDLAIFQVSNVNGE